MSEFAVHLAPRLAPGSCYGRKGKCRQQPRYEAELVYCMCGEAAWSEHVDAPGLEHARDFNCIDVCADCAVKVRQFTCLTRIHSIGKTGVRQ